MNGEVIHCRNFPHGKPFPCMLFYSMDSTLSFSYYYTRLSQKTGIMMFSGKHNYTIALLPALWPSDMKPTNTRVVNDANKYIFILGVKKGLPRFVWYLLNCSWRSVLTRYDMLIWSHFDPETKKREKYAKEMIISVHNYNRLSDKVKTTTMILMHCTTLQTQYMVTWINDILKVGKYTGTTRSLIPWSLLVIKCSK